MACLNARLAFSGQRQATMSHLAASDPVPETPLASGTAIRSSHSYIVILVLDHNVFN